MKHKITITLILLGLFLVSQLVGLGVLNLYKPEQLEVTSGNVTYNQTSQDLPYGLEVEGTTPTWNLVSIGIAFVIALGMLAFFMKFKSEWILRIWFSIVILLALSITIFSSVKSFQHGELIAFLIAIPLLYFKVVKRNILVHNLTEVLIYPGIAVLFVPLLSIGSMALLLILISIYDMYAVWHSGFMQKMAKYQIQKVKVFSGLFIPYATKAEMKQMKKMKGKKGKASIAILGGGDIVFPIIAAGVMLYSYGLLAALAVTLGATIGLTGLFILSEKGKFYPAMPFISIGCLIAMGIVYIL